MFVEASKSDLDIEKREDISLRTSKLDFISGKVSLTTLRLSTAVGLIIFVK
jgi:hypothetical protein